MIMLHDGVVEDHVAELIASEIRKVHWRYEYHSRGKGKDAHPSTHWHRLCGKSGQQIITNGFEWVMPIWTSLRCSSMNLKRTLILQVMNASI